MIYVDRNIYFWSAVLLCQSSSRGYKRHAFELYGSDSKSLGEIRGLNLGRQRVAVCETYRRLNPNAAFTITKLPQIWQSSKDVA